MLIRYVKRGAKEKWLALKQKQIAWFIPVDLGGVGVVQAA